MSALTYIAGIGCEIRQTGHSVTSNLTGQREVPLSGIMKWPQALYLSELVDNAELSQTIGNATGVLEYIDFAAEGPYLTYVSGWYLLRSFDLSADAQWGGHGIDYFVGFSLATTYLGASVEIVFHHVSHARNSDYPDAVTQSLSAHPFFNENADGTGPFLIPPAGTTHYRAYDDAPMTGLHTMSTPGAGAPALVTARKMAVVIE